MKLWYHAGFTPMDQLLDLARILDESGFEGMALTHHLVNPAAIRAPYPYAPDRKVWWDPGSPVPDVWVTAALIGQITSRLTVAPSVFILPMQDVFTVAKAVSTAAYYMDGRLILGVGAGWMEDEFQLTGQDFHKRGRHMDEQIVVLGKLFSAKMTDHRGEFYRFDSLRMEPLPNHPIPLYIGGHSRAALRRAARADGWFGAGPYSLDEAKQRLAELRVCRVEAGTTERPIELILPLQSVPSPAEWAELAAGGASGVMLVPAQNPAVVTLEDRHRFVDQAVVAAGI